MSRRGSVLIVVLWALVVLGAGVFSILYATRLELRVARNHGDRVQARYLALAGVARAAAAIHAADVDRGGRAGDAEARLRADNPSAFRDVELGRGVYRVVRPARPGEGAAGTVFGLDDEESRLNVNVASLQELARVPGLTEDVAAALVDWRDPDGNPTPLGAEASYYADLAPPYRIRNAPFETLAELLRVRGVTAEILLGEDRNANGLLDPEENDGAATAPPDNADGYLDRGWSSFLTVASAVRNVNVQGEPRVNVTTADAEELSAVQDLPAEIAQAIVDARQVRSLQSLVDLLEVRRVEKVEQPAAAPARAAAPAGRTTPQPATPARPASPPNPGAPEAATPPAAGSPDHREGATGANTRDRAQYREVGDPLISRELLYRIADGLTVRESVLEGAVNINTAGPEVLACLPGMTEDLARAVVQHRERHGAFGSIVELLDVSGFTTEIFKKLNPRIAVRSDTWRIAAEGEIPSSGARQRIVAVVRLGERGLTTLYYREEP